MEVYTVLGNVRLFFLDINEEQQSYIAQVHWVTHRHTHMNWHIFHTYSLFLPLKCTGI